jgi:hypothetical protein
MTSANSLNTCWESLQEGLSYGGQLIKYIAVYYKEPSGEIISISFLDDPKMSIYDDAILFKADHHFISIPARKFTSWGNYQAANVDFFQINASGLWFLISKNV